MRQMTLSVLEGEEKIENLHNLAQSVAEDSVREDLQRQIEELKVDMQKRQEESKELEQEQRQAEWKARQTLNELQTKAEIDMKKAKVRSEMWLAFLARESIASVIGGLLLVLITVFLLIAMFFKLSPPDIISNSFMVILGYFFGQAANSILPHGKAKGGNSDKAENIFQES